MTSKLFAAIATYGVEWSKGMSFLGTICSALGHKLKNTLIIRESGDFYEVYYAEYCARCGEVDPQRRLKEVENKA